MSAGTVFYLILIAGGILAMLAMHRGGAGGVGCCGGHGQHTQGHETDRASTPDATSPRPRADIDPPDSSDGHSAAAGSARP